MSFVPGQQNAARLASADMADLIAEPGRDDALQFSAAGLELDARRQRLDLAAWSDLLSLAKDLAMPAKIAGLMAGDIVNVTEGRPALHTACRDASRLADSELAARLTEARKRTRAFCAGLTAPDALGGHPVKRIVNIGIGGSDLGPRMVYDALKAFRQPGIEATFVSNLDPADLDDALEGAEPETTLVLVVSKSFTTQETLMNAQVARAWLAAKLGDAGADARFAAATAAPEKAKAFGLDPSRIFPFEDGVGGRYSLWSPAGLSLEAAFGPDVYDRLLAGAEAMDTHALTAPIESNMAIAKGLIDVWNRKFRELPARCVTAYSSRMERLPAYLQQLEMESLGKSVQTDGTPSESRSGGASKDSGALIWGGKGSDFQHSTFQWLHQGQDETPVDFIGVVDPEFTRDERARALNANLAAQGAALTRGKVGEGDLAAHTAIPGGRASSTILMHGLKPETLGALIALHEHKVFIESLVYGINPFDQYGVELGKQLARAILSGDTDVLDEPALDIAKRLGV